MFLSDISIKRPVLATVMSLVIVLLGLVGYTTLSVREYPNVDEPVITVTTSYSGANAQIMESQVTKPLEDSLAGIEGIKFINSTSREGVSIINVAFIQSRDPDDAAAEVRDKVSRARGALPDDVDEPIIAKVEADSSPIMWLVMSSDNLSAAQLSDLADRFVQDRIQTVEGVAEVTLFGVRKYAMRIWLDPLKLAAYQLTPEDISTVLQNQNVDIPSGRVEGASREFTVQSNTDLNSAEDFRNMVVATRNGAQIKLGDVATVNVGVADDTTSFRFRGVQTVALGVVKQAVANPLDISDGIKAILPTIQSSLPQGVNLEIGYDSSVFIDVSIDNVFRTLIEAVALVVLVILVFLRSFRATLIPLVTIPVSLIGTFFLMQMFGFSINTLTLLALVLAIGLVVDDAIVVLENIFRHIENGMKPMDAAFKGSREIAFPVIAMTLTLAAVYVPIAFMEGRTGKLFTEFALSLAAAVMISGFVALTLSPMMSARLLNKDVGHGKWAKKVEHYITKLETGYTRQLDRVLNVRWLVFPVLAVLGLGIWFTFTSLKSELSPLEDRGVVFTVIVGPEGATNNYMNAYGPLLEKAIEGVPGVRSFGYVLGLGSGRLPLSNQGFGFVRLVDWSERDVKSVDVQGMLFPKLMGIPGFMAIPITPQSLGASGNAKAIEVVLKDSREYTEIAGDMDKLMAKLAANTQLAGVENDLKINTPQIRVILDRAKLADLGISAREAGRAIELLLAGRQVTRFKYNGEQYDVVLQTNDDQRVDASDLAQIPLRTANGAMIPLANVVKLETTVAPRDLNRFDRTRAVTVSSNVALGYSVSEGLAYVEQAIRETFPATTMIDYKGQTREFKESSASMVVTFALAILFIFLVLAAQFESFVDPIIILFTVPLTMLGALLALWLTGNTLNIYSQIGLVTLVGLITKHGILLVEFANEAEMHGKTKMDAIREAAALRVRPILMTTGAMVLGAVPLAIAHGAGAESRQQLGWVIVGGMTFGTLLTLFVLPVIYTYLHRTPKKEEV
ncbi:MAG: efflux RND transporter permease subunit [Blastochloris viridis]|uniref:Efflux RND transporter permease subunit n=1 Tax=Blastochloris viridis TaxID=1079 RepID=A0A6N4RC28_BLAVI|nr:MAG: efflux RND transporter permease subunit [Blastochloris viridis]